MAGFLMLCLQSRLLYKFSSLLLVTNRELVVVGARMFENILDMINKNSL